DKSGNGEVGHAGYSVLIACEKTEGFRHIHLNKRPPLPENIRQMTGSSRGRWEGETLVVETTNFTDKTAFQGSSEKMRLVERFTRVADDMIRYQFTVEDPATCPRPSSTHHTSHKTVSHILLNT